MTGKAPTRAADGRSGSTGFSGKATLWRLVVAAAALLGLAGSLGSARAAGDRWVSAQISCNMSGAKPTVRVTVVNQSGLNLYVAYNRSFATDPDIGVRGLAGMSLADPGQVPAVTIENGASETLLSPWIGSELESNDVLVALVVTNAGILLPACGNGATARIDYDGPQPVLAGEEGQESATIMAETLGRLEAFHAYPALYALLAPEVREQVSYGQVACWYAGQYGPPFAKTTPAVFSTDVLGVKWVNWAWPVTGSEYTGVAEIAYTQQVGTIVKTEQTDPQVEHLVRGDDGLWRWFFGSDASDLAKMPSECGLPATL